MINEKITTVAYFSGEDIGGNVLGEVSAEISKLIENHQFLIFDETLRCLDIKKVSTIMIDFLLRTSFKANKFLVEWDRFYQKAKEEIRSRNLDPEEILRGLEEKPLVEGESNTDSDKKYKLEVLLTKLDNINVSIGLTSDEVSELQSQLTHYAEILNFVDERLLKNNYQDSQLEDNSALRKLHISTVKRFAEKIMNAAAHYSQKNDILEEISKL